MIANTVWFYNRVTTRLANRRTKSPGRRLLEVAIRTVVVFGLAFGGRSVAVRWMSADWGTVSQRIASPTGEYEVVRYEASAMIDPVWVLAIERVDGSNREWFWRSVEYRNPKVVRFTGPLSIEVVDDGGDTYSVDFDEDSLEPSDRFCLNASYCGGYPWDDYTRTGP